MKTKSNAILDRIEKDYAKVFSPTSNSHAIDSGKEIVYYRLYNNPYQTALATTFPDDFWIAINQKWERFGTLEEANQYLCKNKCWKNQ
ncbi:hypothetical protein BGS_0244 [Beggiatoa sp. SS]|nr:hypothetical protein BGS_0244 [Beggiatoa sp. SS]